MIVKILKKGNTPEEKKPDIPSVVKDGMKHTFMSKKGEVEVKGIKKKPLTLRQRRVVSLVGNGSKSKASILRKAGYSEAVVSQPHKVFDSPNVKKEVDDILDRLKLERDEVLKRMLITRKKAGYAVLSMTLGTLNRDIELLSGRPTDRTQYELPEDEKERLRKLLEKNKIK